ncbi:MAG: YciI family protein [Hyphomicrobiaceae bacterium]|nr:YciI family protein [Hyphomicrobiaceae bacterium]
MAEFIFLMHADSDRADSPAEWEAYLKRLVAEDALRAGSALGNGACLRKSGPVPDTSAHLTGYMKIEARDLAHARELVAGNPVYEAGGTVEIRELPLTG